MECDIADLLLQNNELDDCDFFCYLVNIVHYQRVFNFLLFVQLDNNINVLDTCITYYFDRSCKENLFILIEIKDYYRPAIWWIQRSTETSINHTVVTRDRRCIQIITV